MLLLIHALFFVLGLFNGYWAVFVTQPPNSSVRICGYRSDYSAKLRARHGDTTDFECAGA